MKPLPPSEWDPSLQHIIDEMQGRPINLHCLLANHPALLKAWWAYRMYAVHGGSLELRETEIMILRVAVHMQAWYEWAAHVDRGLAAGLTLDEIEKVAQGPAAKGWHAGDVALLTAVDTLIRDRCLPEPIRDELQQHFSDHQILDIIAIQGMYVTIACMIGTWDIPIDDELGARLPKTVTPESFQALVSAANSH
ncbi:MAG TPA: carboxymuconolactone decarboxylase family protein [Woeseiaceae bacterium]|nr:carboxymuconolactone decarboxylase family protein [Woeseiaceae bacterium]